MPSFALFSITPSTLGSIPQHGGLVTFSFTREPTLNPAPEILLFFSDPMIGPPFRQSGYPSYPYNINQIEI